MQSLGVCGFDIGVLGTSEPEVLEHLILQDPEVFETSSRTSGIQTPVPSLTSSYIGFRAWGFRV